MTELGSTILKQIDSIPPVERAELIEELFRSFDRGRQQDIDARWAIEAESRIDAFEQGKISANGVEEVFERINRR